MFLRYLNFCPDIFGHVVKRLDQKPKVYLKVYDVTAWLKKTIIIHILSNISRSKRNHIRKFGQLIEQNKRSIPLRKPYTKSGGFGTTV